jgi:hypothetical protein
MSQYICLENGLLTWNVKSGNEINVSDQIFDYMIFNLKQVNQNIIQKNIFAYKDSDGNIRYGSYNNLNRLKRLKSGNNEDDEFEPINLGGSSADNASNLGSLFEGDDLVGQNLTDVIDMESASWKTNSMGWTSSSGNAFINGYNVQYTIMDNCAYYGSSDCGYNDIVYIDREETPYGYIDIARNSYGDPVISVQYSH